MSFHDDISLDHDVVTYLLRFAVSVLAFAAGAAVTLVTLTLLILR